MFGMRKSLLGCILLAGAIIVALSAAQAQQPRRGMGPGHMGPGGMMGPGMMGQTMMGPGMMGQHMMDHMGLMMRGPMVEGRLAFLKAELAITDAQMPAWKGYVNAAKARMATMQGMHQGMMQSMQSGSAMARMDAHIKLMESMTESLKAIMPATEALYAVLTPDQKQKADLLLSMGCCMM